MRVQITQAEPVPAARLGRVHFTGIGGAGMSGIARIMLARGIPVSGSDARPSALLDELQALGASVHVGHASGHLGGLGPGDTLVVSSAIRADNPELTEATRRGMRVLHRAAALASVMAGRRVIAVAGTHGKTTTSSMLTTVLRACGADPGYVIGGILTETGLGAEDGAGLDFVAEADESDGSFLLLAPDVAVITNVEADHLDNYASLAEIEAAFTTFGQRVTGTVLTCADDPGAEAVAAQLDPVRVRRYGESPHADYRLIDVASRGMAVSFTVAAGRGPFGEIFSQMTVDVPGHHNALNATAAFAAAVELGLAPPRVAAAIAGYRGARRRMELKGEARGVRVLDSYAHHPTEARRRPARGQGHRGWLQQGPGHRDLPAAPVQPDEDLRGRVRRRARAGRRGHRARRVRRQGGPGTRRHRPAHRGRRPRRARQVRARPGPGRRADRRDRRAW